MPITMYGIRNCDNVKKARAWLDQQGIAYAFHDYKTAGIDRPQLEKWCTQLGWETVLNRSGTTFRKLPEKDKIDISDKSAIMLMLAQPSMIRRPVLDLGDALLAGFKSEIYQKMLGKAR